MLAASDDSPESYLEAEAERIHWIEYWESSRTWFEEQGYFLYKHIDVDDIKYAYAEPIMKYPDTPEPSLGKIGTDPFPYPFMHSDSLFSLFTKRPPFSTTERFPDGMINYAQDAKGRHVAIKALKSAEEYKVLRLLKDQPRLLDPDSFPFVIPVLDFLFFDDRWYVVMPRWGRNINHHTFFPTYHLAIKYLLSMLEGLAFLHELRIFHRDIAVKNTLVNYISSANPAHIARASYHRHLKSKGALRYAIMDFDLSMVLDEKTYGSNPRLPIELVVNIGQGTRPYETMHAYIDFDPFKYDVACLGVHFSDYFKQIIIDVPLLAPLIDRMITSDIDKRFTASEALAFARNLVLPSISSLGNFERESNVEGGYQRIDRWTGLPESFLQEWGSYRENYSSWTMRLRNYLYFSEFRTQAWYLMYYSRYLMRVLAWAPRTMLRLFSSAQKWLLPHTD